MKGNIPNTKNLKSNLITANPTVVIYPSQHQNNHLFFYLHLPHITLSSTVILAAYSQV